MVVAEKNALVIEKQKKHSSLKTFIQAVKCTFSMQMHHLACQNFKWQ